MRFARVSQEVTDEHLLVPMVRRIRATVGALPDTVVADAGYWNTEALRDPLREGIGILVSPDSRPHAPGGTPPKTNARNPDAWRMRERLATPHGRSRQDQRKQTIEPVFGEIKEARGIRRFRLRGLPQAECEWDLICATHNLLKLFRHRRGRPPLARPAAAVSDLLRTNIGLVDGRLRGFTLLPGPVRPFPCRRSPRCRLREPFPVAA